MGKKVLKKLAFLLVPFMLTGCQLLPKEEELPVVPPIYVYEAEEYKQTTVMRGDLEKITKIYCTYVAVDTEIVSFSLGGVYIDEILVEEGQRVRAGDLLATLEQENLQEKIEEQEYQLKIQELQKTHLLQNRELALKECDLRWEGEQWQHKREEVIESYARQLQDLEDAIYLRKLQLEEQKAERKDRQIVAGIDGTVTYVKKTEDGLRSVKGEAFVMIKNFDTAVFQVKGENAAHFPVGTQVSFTCKQKSYTAVSVDPTELGLETSGQVAYLKLLQPDPSLEDGAKGTIVIVLDQKSDVLYVNKQAVKTANGEPFVYMLNEEGLRIMQKVTVGIETNTHIEITGGLKEGDKVILE